MRPASWRSFSLAARKTASKSKVPRGLPFPVTDGLYGLTPDKSENFGVNLGALAPRGERDVLIVNLDSVLRVSSNPFFPYLLDRIEEGMVASAKPRRQ